jgi:hypothetical protein
MSAAEPPKEVVIALPPPAKAPGFRTSLADRAQMRVRDVCDGFVAVEPVEGAGAVSNYFTLQRLADASTGASNET